MRYVIGDDTFDRGLRDPNPVHERTSLAATSCKNLFDGGAGSDFATDAARLAVGPSYVYFTRGNGVSKVPQ